MDRLDKFISVYADDFFMIALLEAFIIIALIVFIYYRKRNNDEKATISYYEDKLNKKNSDVEYWRSEYYKVYRELNVLKSKEQGVNSGLENKNQNYYRNPNNEQVQRQNSFNSHEEYVRHEQEKLNRIQKTINKDGTIKSTIDFDLSNDEDKSVPAPPKYEFLEAANGGQFRKLLSSDEKSFFRTWDENGVRRFEFYGNVEKTLANINAIFDDVCEIEGKQNGATQITNVEPGILNSQLKVEKKAKIRLT